MLRQVGITVELDDTPRQGAADWRLRAARTVTADLILVNTMGNADFFDLTPGQCKPGDVPILNVPAALHIVHSWSLLAPDTRDTLGGRWLERGVFAYAGSVNEPFLEAFVPTPAVAAQPGSRGRPSVRRSASMAASSGRSPFWATPSTRSAASPSGLTRPPWMGASMSRQACVSCSPAASSWRRQDILTLTGRDADAAILMKSMLDKPGVVTPEIARRRA